MYLFEVFEPGKIIGTRSLTLSADLVQQWLMVFPQDDQGDRMPPGMTAAVLMRAYCDILRLRPPGNVHGQQNFSITELPVIGDTLVTTLTCEKKELKGERRWLTCTSQTNRSDGALMFSGIMTMLWAG